jgi:hypothetical protein
MSLEVLGHRRGEDHPAADRPPREELVDPSAHCSVAVVGKGQRLPGHQTDQTARRGGPLAQRKHEHLAAVASGLQGVHILPVVIVVDERADVHNETSCETPQQMKRPDLVALVGRVRDAVRKEQQFLHEDLP